MKGEGLTVPVSSLTAVKLKVGLLTNPDTQLSPSSFTMTSFTDDTQLYSIDKISNNLFP